MALDDTLPTGQAGHILDHDALKDDYDQRNPSTPLPDYDSSTSPLVHMRIHALLHADATGSGLPTNQPTAGHLSHSQTLATRYNLGHGPGSIDISPRLNVVSARPVTPTPGQASMTLTPAVVNVVEVPFVSIEGGTVLLDANFESATVASPISNADMWAAVGGQYGNNTSTFEDVSVVNVGGAHGKVANHYNAANQFIDSANDYGMAMFVPLSESAEEAICRYDMRWLTPSGTVGANNPWGKGGKLPGLCGVAPGHGSPPSGGSPSVWGWSGRLMWLVPGVGAARSPVELLLYLYDAVQASGTYGQNKLTGQGWAGSGGFAALDEWATFEIYYKLNTVTTDNVSWSSNGIARLKVNGVQVLNLTNLQYRKYKATKITHFAYDNFFGGGTVDWAPTGNTNTQFDNFKVIKIS